MSQEDWEDIKFNELLVQANKAIDDARKDTRARTMCCDACRGRGFIVDCGGSHAYGCMTCDGFGYVKP